MNFLDPLFEWFYRSTFHGGVLALLLLGVQALIRKRVSPQWRYYLWLPLIIVLILPALPRGNWGTSEFTPIRLHLPLSTDLSQAGDSIPNKGGNPRSILAMEPAVLRELLSFIKVAWLTGAISIFSFSLSAYLIQLHFLSKKPLALDSRLLTILRQVAAANDLRTAPKVLVSEAADSPALMGFFRPLLTLPPNLLEKFNEHEVRLVIEHEIVHLKRHDLLINWLLLVIQAIHWCNPLIWIAVLRIKVDRELACDDAVLRTRSRDQRIHYGHTLLKIAAGIPSPIATAGFIGILESKSLLSARIREIAVIRPWTASWIMLATAGIFFLTILAATRSIIPLQIIIGNESPDKNEGNALFYKGVASFKKARKAELNNDSPFALENYEQSLRYLSSIKTPALENQHKKIRSITRYIAYKLDELNVAPGATNPEKQILLAETSLRLAMQAEANHRPGNALKRYQESLSALLEIKELLPEWNSSLMDFKIQFISDKIKQISPALVNSSH